MVVVKLRVVKLPVVVALLAVYVMALLLSEALCCYCCSSLLGLL